MSNFIVKKVAVLGAGVMGAQIAAHLANAEVPVVLFGGRETTHNKLNADLGLPTDGATAELLKFVNKWKGDQP